MDFAALKQEFFSRGFQFLQQDSAGQTRAKNWLNESYLEDICDPEPWPFLEIGFFGESPLELDDLKDVLYVIDYEREVKLPSTDIRDLTDRDPKLDATGPPQCYFVLDSGGSTFIAVYPSGELTTVAGRYIKTPPVLSADGDTPLLPARFHSLIVDGAVIRAYRDNDDWQAAQSAQSALDLRLAKMSDALFSRNLDNTAYVTRVELHEGGSWGVGW